jgi:hypothetical protein
MKTAFLKNNRYFKFAFAGVGILAAAAVTYEITSPSQKPHQIIVEEASVAKCQHGVGCSHDHGSRAASDSTESPYQFPARKLAEPLLAGSQSISESQRGDLLELDFGGELQLSTRVLVKTTFAGKEKSVNMELLGREGSVYWLEKVDGSVMGNIILKEDGKNIVYEYSGQDGDWVIRQITQQQFLCSNGDTDDSIGMPIGDAPEDQVGQAGIIPLLNSLPGAVATVYIDFDGEEVSGTRWVNGGTINAEPSGLDEQNIRQFWEVVAEDMRPFKINVTTDRAVFDAAPQNKKMMCIVTPTNDAAPGAGGVAYLNSFYDGSIDPCWCFNLGDPDTVSHEIGHTFGLRHDGLDSLEYHPGNGTWGPIMGAAFGSSVQTWSIGDYEGNTNTEDDLDIIDARSAKFRDDQYGESAADGFDLAEETGDVDVGIVGIIETPEDVDVFRFTTSGGNASLRVTPESGNYDNVVNMNMRLQLYNEAGDLIIESDPANSYAASIDTELEAGNYTVHVEGTNSGSPDVSGFSDYGSIGQYGLTGDVEGLGGLIVEINQPQLEEVSIADGNGLVLAASVVGSEDFVNWKATGVPVGGGVAFSSTSSKATRATFTGPGLYTLRFRASLDPIFTDKELKVSVESANQAPFYENRGPVVRIQPEDLYYSMQGLITGRVSDDGVPSTAQPAYEWKVVSGNAEISNIRAQRPNVIFKDNQPNIVSLESSDGQIRTFAQAQVQSFFDQRVIAGEGASGRWFIPQNNDLSMDWTKASYDDSAWNRGGSGFGFDPDGRYSFFIGNGSDLQSAMRGKSSSAFIRLPFSLPQLNYVQGVKLSVNYNDAFVAYVNGVEVARRNAPSGELRWDSKAVSSRSQQSAFFAEEIDLMQSEALLNTGENILAIHGMNAAVDDGDFLLNPVIEAELIASPFFSFLEQNGLEFDANELPGGDSDGDNNINLVEHALNLSPLVANGELSPLAAGSSSNGSIKITLPIDAPEDVDYYIERARGGVGADDWQVIASKRGSASWSGNSIFTMIDKKVGGNVTYSLRELNVAPDSSNVRLYRLGYSLRGPIANPEP